MDRVRCLTAADVEDEPGKDVEPVRKECRIDAALEAAACVTGQAELLAGLRDAVGREEGDLEHHVGRSVADARMLAAHDAADVVHLALVGDDRHRRIERVFLLVEREHLLAISRGACDERSVQLGDVVGVCRAADVEHDVIGYVDQRRDRPLACTLQAALHPVR